MKKAATSILVVCLSWASIPALPATEDQLAAGKAIAFDRNRGNCLSCHMMDDGELPGNSAPPLMMMQARFPDRAVLREQIYDAGVRNPNTVMPPYGRHRILSEEELDLVVDYVHSL
jgi:sulfur-oxidizing protein SoxX